MLLITNPEDSTNPVLPAFVHFLQGLKGGNKVEHVREWPSTYRIPLLPGDVLLIENALQELFERIMASQEGVLPSWISLDDLVFGPGKLLLSIVTLRIYLGRKPEDDHEIARLVVGFPVPKPTSDSVRYIRNYHFLRRTTIPEYMMAALQGEPIEDYADADSLLLLDVLPNDLSRIGATIVDMDLQWFGEQPLSFLALKNNTDKDEDDKERDQNTDFQDFTNEVMYVWPNSTSSNNKRPQPRFPPRKTVTDVTVPPVNNKRQANLDHVHTERPPK